MLIRKLDQGLTDERALTLERSVQLKINALWVSPCSPATTVSQKEKRILQSRIRAGRSTSTQD